MFFKYSQRYKKCTNLGIPKNLEDFAITKIAVPILVTRLLQHNLNMSFTLNSNDL